MAYIPYLYRKLRFRGISHTLAMKMSDPTIQDTPFEVVNWIEGADANVEPVAGTPAPAVAATDLAAAPAVWTQASDNVVRTFANTLKTRINEGVATSNNHRNKINELAGEVNELKAIVNDLIAKMQQANMMETP